MTSLIFVIGTFVVACSFVLFNSVEFINNKFGMLAGPGASLSVMGDNKLKGWIPKRVIMFKGICA